MKLLFKLLNAFLLVVAIIIAYCIFTKKDVNFNRLKSLFETMTNYLNIGKEDKSVSNFPKFISISDDKYYNDNYSVYTPKKGTVMYVTQNSITIKCHDNYYAYFSNVINVKVSKLDVVTDEYALANFIDYFTFYYIYNGNKYTYEEIAESY